MNEPLSRELLISQSLNEIDASETTDWLSQVNEWQCREVGDWKCPECHNIFSYVDGIRISTQSYKCKCASMPQSIRKKRIAMGRLEQGVLGLQ